MTGPLRGRAGARGMTLVEMMIAMVVFVIVLGAALAFLSRQSRAYRLGTERMEVLQNLRFAAGVLARDLRTAGANLPSQQPQIVYAGADVIAYNGDYTTNIAGDPWAVYYDPDAPNGAVTALRTAQQITIPNTGTLYPTVNYEQAGVNSPAELQIFYFAADGSTARTDDFILFRQVNNGAPEMVARNLLRTGNTPFFQYFRLRTPNNAPAFIEQLPNGQVPVIHSAPLHQSPADVSPSALADSLHGTVVSFTATNGLTGARERRRALSRLVRFPNAGMATRQTCGDGPILGVALNATVVGGAGSEAVRLTWNRAVDEGGGERDVERYVIWRRIAGAASWGDPYRSFPAGSASYQWDDQVVDPATTYEYALAAQDCTPTLSARAISAPAAVP